MIGTELLREVRDETITLPVMLSVTSKRRAIEGEAISDYITLTESTEQMIGELLDRIGQVVRSAQQNPSRGGLISRCDYKQ